MHHTVDISGLAVAPEADHFPLADVDLGERERNGGAVPGGQGDQWGGLGPQSPVLTDEAGHGCLEILQSYDSLQVRRVQ